MGEAAADLVAKFLHALHVGLGNIAEGMRRVVDQQVGSMAHRAIVHRHQIVQRLERIGFVVGVYAVFAGIVPVFAQARVHLDGQPDLAVRAAVDLRRDAGERVVAPHGVPDGIRGVALLLPTQRMVA